MGKLGDILAHPEEILPLARMYVATKQATKLPKDPNLAFCYDILNSVSRSFAVVIQQLGQPLRDAVCIFYLVLRGLDTVEDDMALAEDVKVPALLDFHNSIYQRDFTMACGYGHYVRLMQQFHIVVEVFLGLEQQYQEVIADITRRMGEGMAEFIQKEVITVEDYNDYCHYVAGLVGIGLSQLFASSGLESPSIAGDEVLANDMGLFLQKANIIRDYLEDILEEPRPRMFWPRDIWGRYAADLEEFKEATNRTAAIHCLNHMVTDALGLLPACITYMSQLKDPRIFRFCAIPQIMAVGTYAICYNNGKVFEGVVKLRRGLTARVFEETHTMADLYRWYLYFLRQLQVKADTQVASHDPTVDQLQQEVERCIGLCVKGLESCRAAAGTATTSSERFVDLLLLAGVGAWAYHLWQPGSGSIAGLNLSVGQLLPQYVGLEKAVVLMLLVAAFLRVVLGRVTA